MSQEKDNHYLTQILNMQGELIAEARSNKNTNPVLKLFTWVIINTFFVCVIIIF